MSEEALRLIREEKKYKTGKLDLRRTWLTEIPKEVFELTWLEELIISFTTNNDDQKNLIQITNDFQKLKHIETLNLSGYVKSNILLDFPSIIELPKLKKLTLANVFFKDTAWLQQLSGLESLSLIYLPIDHFHWLEKLTELRSLFVYSCSHISTHHFSPLKELESLLVVRTQLENIENLSKCKKLIELHLDQKSVTKDTIRHIQVLTQLESLSLRGCDLKDIAFVQDLTNLKRLDVNNNEIKSIEPVQTLRQLQSLELANNPIADFTPLLHLLHLIELNLFGNPLLTDLTPFIPIIKEKNLEVNVIANEFDSSTKGLFIGEKHIETPPVEIAKQGREAILEWFEANKAKLNEVKLILIGDPKAGKTSLLRRLKDGSFDANEPQTDGINIEDIAFDSCPSFPEESALKDITGHFWDFGGQEIMNSTHQFFLTNRSVYILVLNARNDKEVSNQIRKWVQRIQATGGNSSIIVVANQIDVNPGFGFENETNLQEEFPQIKGFLEVSCLDGKHIKQLVALLEEWIPKAEMFETEIDERWLPIKKQLEEETKGEKNKKGRYLDEPRFHEICEAHGLDSSTSQDSLVKFLHDLGMLLHFEGIRENLSEYYVLDPYWITYGVYQILTSRYAGERKGIVPIAKLDYIVNVEPDKSHIYQPKQYEKIKYSPNQRRFLVDILHEFKLCFYVNNRQQFIIPDLLETNAPEEATKPFRKSDQALRFVYQYTYIPSSIIPQIMVEAHGMLEHIWRTGCILSHDGSRAMINAYQNQILIIVEGEAKKKREFMSIIRYLIDQINGKLSDPPKMMIPLPNLPNEFVSYKKLRSLEKRGERTYPHFSEEKEEDFEYSVSELLEGLAPIQQDLKLLEEVQELKAMMQAGATKLDIIHEHQMEHYAYLRTNLPPDWDEKLLDGITSLQIEQVDEIRQELIKALAKAFELHKGDMDEQLKDIYLKMTEPKKLSSLKLKVGLPLLASMVPGLPEIPDVTGIPKVSVEAEFDLKGWSERMYKKYELELFKVMGKIGSK